MTSDTIPFDDCLKYGHLWVNDIENHDPASTQAPKVICLFCGTPRQVWNDQPIKYQNPQT